MTMFNHKVMPMITDTDAMGHITHTRLPVWFANARTPLFRFFSPQLDLDNWPLILASISVKFIEQIYHDVEVEVRTHVKKIGNSSFTVHHEAWQNGRCAASGEAIMVQFDYKSRQSIRISDTIREKLQDHLIKDAEQGI